MGKELLPVLFLPLHSNSSFSFWLSVLLEKSGTVKIAPSRSLPPSLVHVLRIAPFFGVENLLLMLMMVFFFSDGNNDDNALHRCLLIAFLKLTESRAHRKRSPPPPKRPERPDDDPKIRKERERSHHRFSFPVRCHHRTHTTKHAPCRVRFDLDSYTYFGHPGSFFNISHITCDLVLEAFGHRVCSS